jgi:hypothetical protein
MPRRSDHVEVDEREPVVLVVVGQERERRVLVLDLGVEDRLVPAHHGLEAARAVDDMNELGGTNAGHGVSGLADGGNGGRRAPVDAIAGSAIRFR